MRASMLPFIYRKYYYDPSDQGTISPSPFGIDLISQYLGNKYNAQICHPISYFNHSGWTHANFVHFSHYTDIEGMLPYLLKARNQSMPYRIGFIVHRHGHAVFMAYIKEDGKEGILYSDSTDTNDKWVTRVAEITGIPVYASMGQRQADNFSCIIDAIVMSRDVTRKNPATNEYDIPHLLHKLEERAEEKDGWYKIKLPDKLLKSSQISSFVKAHEESDPKQLIHKSETLTLFRKRYQESTSGHHVYLQKKSEKYAGAIQIQYYLNQINEASQEPLTPEQTKEFIDQAKVILRSHPPTDLFKHGDPLLHEFAENYLAQFKQKTETSIEFEETSISIQALSIKYNTPYEQLCAEIQSIENQLANPDILINAIATELNKKGEMLLGKIMQSSNKRALVEYLAEVAITSIDNSTNITISIILSEIALNNQHDADFILKSQNFISRLTKPLLSGPSSLKEQKLCYNAPIRFLAFSRFFDFISKDAYFIRQLFVLYPNLSSQLFTSEEKQTLDWVIEYKSEKSRFIGYIAIAERVINQFSDRIKGDASIEGYQRWFLESGYIYDHKFKSAGKFLLSIESKLSPQEKESIGWLPLYRKPDDVTKGPEVASKRQKSQSWYQI